MTTGRRATSVAATEHLREVVVAGELERPERSHVRRPLRQAGVKRSRALIPRDGGDAVADILVGWQTRRRLGHHARFDDVDRLCHDARHEGRGHASQREPKYAG